MLSVVTGALTRRRRPLVNDRVAAGGEEIVRRHLILVGALLIPIAPRLVAIRPGLILVAQRLIAFGGRLVIDQPLLRIDHTRAAARRTRQRPRHDPPPSSTHREFDLDCSVRHQNRRPAMRRQWLARIALPVNGLPELQSYRCEHSIARAERGGPPSQHRVDPAFRLDGDARRLDRLRESLGRRSTPGWPSEAHYGWGWVDMVHPEDAERARSGWEHAVRTEETPAEIEYRMRRHDGEFRWHIVRGSSGAWR